MEFFKKNGILFLAIIAVVVIAFVFRPDASKKLRDLFKKDLQEKELVFKKKYDSLQDVRTLDSIKYAAEFQQMDQEIDIIKNKLELQKQKSKIYEKELATYRRGDFDERFRAFSNLVKKDSLQ